MRFAGLLTALFLLASAPLPSQTTPYYIVNTVAGRGKLPYSGDGKPANTVYLFQPGSMTYDKAGNLYFTESYYSRLLKISTSGVLSTAAGCDGDACTGATATTTKLSGPRGVAVDASGNVYLGDGNRLLRIAPGGAVTIVAGTGDTSYSHGDDGGQATKARLATPYAIALDGSGNIFFTEFENHVVRKVASDGTISTVAGDGKPSNEPNGVSGPRGVAVDRNGSLFFSDSGNHRVRKVTPAGIINTVAGNGKYGYNGDGGQAVNAQLYSPYGLAFDAAGNLYISDTVNHRVRKVTPAGIISTVAGAGMAGVVQSSSFRGDTGLATSAFLNEPAGLAIDNAGNLYIADSGNDRIRVIGAERYTGPDKPKPASVMNAADYSTKVAPATWITIKGTNLSSTTRQWNDADFIDGKLPVQLDGVRVFVDGMPAYVSYISPTQINALVGASDMKGGPIVPVEILTTQGRGDPVTAPGDARYAPALFRYDAEGGKYVVANALDGMLIGKSGLVPGLDTRPARHGELLSAYGTGFGATNPAIPHGTAAFAPAVLASSAYLLTDDNWIIRPVYAGLIGPGLYQLVFQVPETPDGDYRFTPNVGGGAGSPVWITIRH